LDVALNLLLDGKLFGVDGRKQYSVWDLQRKKLHVSLSTFVPDNPIPCKTLSTSLIGKIKSFDETLMLSPSEEALSNFYDTGYNFRGGDDMEFFSPPPGGFDILTLQQSFTIVSLLHNRWIFDGQIVILPIYGSVVFGLDGGVQGWMVCTLSFGDTGKSGPMRIVAGSTIVRNLPTSLSREVIKSFSYDFWLDAAMKAVPGLEGPLRDLAALFKVHLDQRSKSGLGVLVVGPLGVGKSLACETLSRTSGFPIFKVSCSSLFSSRVGGTESRIHHLEVEASKAADRRGAAWVILEDADLLLPLKPKSLLTSRCREAILLTLEVTTRCSRVFWLALTSRPQALTPIALGPSRLRETYKFPLPSHSERESQLVNSSRLSGKLSLSLGAPWAAERTPGFTRADLEQLTRLAFEEESAKVVAPVASTHNFESWERALCKIKPSLLATAIGEPPREIPLSSIFPSTSVRCATAAVLLPLARASLFKGMSKTLDPPRGLLITGPPGTGKTHLAHSIAHTALSQGLANALVLTGPDIISPLVGASEVALSRVFSKARELSPCILVLDHFEVLAQPRKLGCQREDRLLSVLLTEMDGVAGAEGSYVAVVAISREEEDLDAAILRPGRLELRARTALPEEQERRMLLMGGGMEGMSPSRQWSFDALEAAIHATKGQTHAATASLWGKVALRALRRCKIGPVVTVEDVHLSSQDGVENRVAEN